MDIRYFIWGSLLIILLMDVDLNFLPLKSEKEVITDLEAIPRSRNTTGYYIFTDKGHKFTTDVECYDYCSTGDTITCSATAIFNKTLRVSFIKESQLFSFNAGLRRIRMDYFIKGNFIILLIGITLHMLNRFNFQKERIIGASFFISCIFFIYFLLVK